MGLCFGMRVPELNFGDTETLNPETLNNGALL